MSRHDCARAQSYDQSQTFLRIGGAKIDAYVDAKSGSLFLQPVRSVVNSVDVPRVQFSLRALQAVGYAGEINGTDSFREIDKVALVDSTPSLECAFENESELLSLAYPFGTAEIVIELSVSSVDRDVHFGLADGVLLRQTVNAGSLLLSAAVKGVPFPNNVYPSMTTDQIYVLEVCLSRAQRARRSSR